MIRLIRFFASITHQQKNHLRFLLFCFTISNPLLIFGQPSIDIEAPLSDSVYFGGKIIIPEITISEGSTTPDDIGDFPITVSESHVIRLTAPTGFKISSLSDPIKNEPGNVFSIEDAPELTTPLKSVELEFIIDAGDILDEISFESITLTPDTYSSSNTYSGKLKVELFLNGSATATPSKTFPSGEDDYYVMEVPVLDITYDDVACDGLPYIVTCEITNATKTFETISSGDHRLHFRYRYSGTEGVSNTTYNETISSSDGAGGPYEFTISSFDAEHDQIRLKYFAAEDDANTDDINEEWAITEYLYIDGYTGTEDIDITIETPPEITFVDDESSVSVTIYEADVPLSKYINDAGNCEFLIDSDDAQYFYEDTDGEYYFMAGSAAEGTFRVLVSKDNENGNCEVWDSLFITVIPDVISAEDNYCYGLENNYCMA